MGEMLVTVWAAINILVFYFMCTFVCKHKRVGCSDLDVLDVLFCEQLLKRTPLKL